MSSLKSGPRRLLRSLSVIVRRRWRQVDPGRLLLLGYTLYMLIGWALLALPFAQSQPVSPLDSLFIAASAVSTTGLVTVDPGTSFSLFGEVVILMLIQAGGIGYMTLGSFVALSLEHRLSLMRDKVARAAFPLPHDFDLARFIRDVVVFTLAVELAGAAALLSMFAASGVDNPAWSAIFHSVSAFCTAGFSLNATSFEGFAGHFGVNAVLAMLSLLGAVGFIVISELWGTSVRRKALSFTSKIILKATAFLVAAGTLLIFLADSSSAGLEPWQRLQAAFFQAMTASTTVGFNTIPIGDMSTAALVVLMALMVIGASPSGTGGGLKTTTMTVLVAIMRSVMKRRSSIRFMKREIAPSTVLQASASAVFYGLAAFGAIVLLGITERAPLRDVAFEALSALGTVGLSTGITSTLTELGKVIVIALMLIGRVGALTFALAIASRDETREEEADSEVVM